ncbi:NTP transferase domain-containing protein [Candidatus Peregrinibacteria bacterium]|nr:NTP transferase domain-containing protein [Candidatus Peregrinibacteria bacterium]
MKVLLLAAGRSQRMQPVPDKNFLMFLGKPLIVHQIESLIDAGFNDFVVIGGAHNLDKLKALEFENITYQVVEQENLDEGMAGAVIACEDFVGEDPICIVSSNDVVDEKAYELVVDAANDKEVDSVIVGKKVEQYFPGGYLEIDSDGFITSIIEKPGEGNEPSDLVNIVIHCHKNPKKLIKELKTVSSDRDDRYEVALDSLIKGGAKMKAAEFDGYWQPIKFPWHVFDVMKYFFGNMGKSISKDAQIAESAVIKGDVIIEEGARIFDHATVSGPAYIGKGVIVANNSLVRDSMVNEGCVVGYSTEIARSYLGKNVWTHTNYIGDSIISDNCSFGSGTVTGNLRLDEKNIPVNVRGKKVCSGTNKFGLVTGENIRCGINTSFMPGVKIGSNCMIGAGLVIPKDIEANTFVKGGITLDIRENKATLDENARDTMKGKI